MLWVSLSLATLMAQDADPDDVVLQVTDSLIQAAECDNAAQRCDHLLDAADRIVDALDGRPERAEKLGESYGRILEGVERSSAPWADEADDASAEKWQHVESRIAHHLEVLEGVRARAPEAAWHGLDRALEASRHGREHAHGHGRGPGDHPDHPEHPEHPDHPTPGPGHGHGHGHGDDDRR